MRIVHVVGARPNFIKVSPVIAALGQKRAIEQKIVHTGQHYDINMSDIFFSQLGIPKPDVNLEVGSASHAQQTAQIIMRFEHFIQHVKPDIVLVYGDVNSTLAAAIVCSKMGVRIAHIEAGLRSFDRTMPEEVNRVVTDHLANILYTPSADANENLEHEGIAKKTIKLVGNVMIDTLLRLLPQADMMWDKLSGMYSLRDREFGLVTLHRVGNVDDPEILSMRFNTLLSISHTIPLVFPIHPRTRARLRGVIESKEGMLLLEPQGYLQFLCLQRHARFVITDSGGIQEETTFLKVPCITLRKNTERPITVTRGTNCLVGDDMQLLLATISSVLSGNEKRGSIPPLWDGKAGERIACSLSDDVE